MKERPILFTGEMVRAILDGGKTQTRRLVKNQKHPHGTWATPEEVAAEFIGGTCAFSPPKGRVGDLLWVCETFYWEEGSDKTTEQVAYRASTEMPPEVKAMGCCWTPSIHMPRWASRIDLEITAVRVERVQDMEGMDAASSDALKEGVHRIHHEGGNYYYSAFRNQPDPKNWTDPCLAFKELWQSIYGNRPKLQSKRYQRVKRWLDTHPPTDWDANPWVWVYEFRRIKP